MNKDKRTAVFLKVKHFAENRQKRVNFNINPKVDRLKDMRDDLKLLKRLNFEIPATKESDVLMEKLDLAETQSAVLQTEDFWDFVCSDKWQNHTSLRVCEGELLDHLKEQYFQLEACGATKTQKVARFDKLTKYKWPGCLTYPFRSPQVLSSEPIKITFTYFTTNEQALQGVLSADGFVRPNEEFLEDHETLQRIYISFQCEQATSTSDNLTRSVEMECVPASGDSAMSFQGNSTTNSSQSILSNRKISSNKSLSMREGNNSLSGTRSSKDTISSGSQQNDIHVPNPEEFSSNSLPMVGHLGMTHSTKMLLEPSVSLVAQMRKPLFMAKIPSVEAMLDEEAVMDASKCHDTAKCSTAVLLHTDISSSVVESNIEDQIVKLSYPDKQIMTNIREHVANTPIGEVDLHISGNSRKYNMLKNLRTSSQMHHDLEDKWSIKSTKATSATPLIIKSMKAIKISPKSINSKLETPVSPLVLLKPVPFKDRSIEILPYIRNKDTPNQNLLDRAPAMTKVKSNDKQAYVSSNQIHVGLETSNSWKTTIFCPTPQYEGNTTLKQRGRKASRWSDSEEVESELTEDTMKQIPLNTDRLNKCYSIERMRLFKRRKLRMRNVNRTCHRNRWRKKAILSQLESKYGHFAYDNGVLMPKAREPIKLLKHDSKYLPQEETLQENTSSSTLNVEDYFTHKELPRDFRRRCYEATERFIVRKEQITFANPWKTITTFTFNKLFPFRYC